MADRQYVEVAVDSLVAPFSLPLHYRLPDELRDRAAIGCRLLVPLRRGESEGYLLSFPDRPAVSDLREVLAVVEDTIPLPADLLHLGRWLVDQYGCAAGWAFRVVGPPRTRRPAGARRRSTEAETDGVRPAPAPRPGVTLAPREPAAGPSLVLGDRRTAVYRAELAACLQAGRRAIVLSPEISGLKQVTAELTSVLAAAAGEIHGDITASRRRLRWTAIARGEVDIVTGTRSAVFAPVPDLGLIIVDEEQDESYKQPEVPRYHARDVAIERARVTGARVILGSSAPSPEALWLCRETTTTTGDDSRPQVVGVDLRDELLAGNRGLLSRELRRQIERTLAARGRTILLLNRLGYAGSLLCRRCGAVAGCEDCGVAFTPHAGATGLRCTCCGKRKVRPEVCPQCGSDEFRPLGGGTERLEAEVRAAFPGATVDRLDSIAAPGRRQQEAVRRRFLRGETEILVGTQLVAEVLPGVALLGVVSIDAALHFPDFRASERAFQLLHRMARRLGPDGLMVLQSFTPRHYALECFARADHSAFYRQELAIRRQLGYPPFRRLARVVVTGPASAARELVQAIRDVAADAAEVLGPAPALQPLAAGRQRWSILLRGDGATSLAGILREAWAAWPSRRGGRVVVDIDPLDLT